MQPTMEDVAREAGVSMMTVSRVFSGRSTVSAATRTKVLEAAQRHNYEVNVLAQNFAQKRSGFVGLATPLRLIGTDYFSEAMKGFETVFGGTSWDYALFNLHSTSFDDGNRLLKLHRRRRVDGLLAIAPNVEDKFLETFVEHGFPLVVVGKQVKSSKVCWVRCDDYQGVYDACERLCGLGHRRIAFLAGPAGFSVAQQREKAYRDFCRDRGLRLPGWFVQRGDYSARSGRDAVAALQFASRARPTAIVAANDGMAFGAMEGVRAFKLKIPDDISVVGYDDSAMSAQCYPALTTVHQPIFEIAQRSARLLSDALDGATLPTGHFTLPVSLTMRESTAACPKGARGGTGSRSPR